MYANGPAGLAGAPGGAIPRWNTSYMAFRKGGASSPTAGKAGYEPVSTGAVTSTVVDGTGGVFSASGEDTEASLCMDAADTGVTDVLRCGEPPRDSASESSCTSSAICSSPSSRPSPASSPWVDDGPLRTFPSPWRHVEIDVDDVGKRTYSTTSSAKGTWKALDASSSLVSVWLGRVSPLFPAESSCS